MHTWICTSGTQLECTSGTQLECSSGLRIWNVHLDCTFAYALKYSAGFKKLSSWSHPSFSMGSLWYREDLVYTDNTYIYPLKHSKTIQGHAVSGGWGDNETIETGMKILFDINS